MKTEPKPMTDGRIHHLRQAANDNTPVGGFTLHECLNEIERLREDGSEVEQLREALNLAREFIREETNGTPNGV